MILALKRLRLEGKPQQREEEGLGQCVIWVSLAFMLSPS